MKIFKKAGQPQRTKLQTRISGIGTSELVIWAENSLSEIGRNVAGLGEKTFERYAEAEIAAEALLAICQELKKRSSDVL
jgi:hypothetical protein